MYRYYFVLFVLVACIASGCGKRGTDVSGRILLNGDGLENMNVLFQPVEPGRDSVSGLTDAEGRFVLKRVFGKGTGVDPGDYRVFITWVNTEPHTEFDKTPPAVCPYTIPVAAGCGDLVRRVEAQGSQVLDIELAELKDVSVEMRKGE